MYYSHGELVPQTPDERQAWSEAKEYEQEVRQGQMDEGILPLDDDIEGSDPDDCSSFEQLKEQEDYEQGNVMERDDE